MSLSFVKMYVKMTKLCSFNEDNPQFLSVSSVMQNLLQANSPGFIETLQICTRWTTTSGTPFCTEEQNKLQPKPKMTDESKVALQTIWKELPQEHINKAVANFTKRLTAYTWLWLQTVGICSNFVHPSSSLHYHLIINKPTGSFQSHQQVNGEDNVRSAEKWGLSWLKLQNFVIFTALHAMQTRYSDENSVCLSVCPSHAWIVTKR